MPLVWTLVSTIVREADGSGAHMAAKVTGDQVITIRARAAANMMELWRSDDRGVTWAFTQIPSYVDGQNVYGISDPFSGSYWWTNVTRNATCRTPTTNPGAGGFTEESTVGTNGFIYPQPSGSFLYGLDDGSATGFYRRTAAATYSLVVAVSSDKAGMNTIPGETDLLILQDSVGNKRLRRIAPLTGTMVQNVALGTSIDGIRPRHQFTAIDANEIISAMLDTTGTGTSRIWRSTDGGASYTEAAPVSGFWTGITSVVNTQVGQGSNFYRTGGELYGFLHYFDPTNTLQHRRHIKLMRFDTTSWAAESNDTNDGGVVIDTAVGLNDAGDVDFYAATYDDTIDTTRWYRLTIAGTSSDYEPDTCP